MLKLFRKADAADASHARLRRDLDATDLVVDDDCAAERRAAHEEVARADIRRRVDAHANDDFVGRRPRDDHCADTGAEVECCRADVARQVRSVDRQLLLGGAAAEGARNNADDGRVGADARQRDIHAQLVVSTLEPAAGYFLPARLDEHHFAPRIRVARNCRPTTPLIAGVDDGAAGARRGRATACIAKRRVRREFVLIFGDSRYADAAVKRSTSGLVAGEKPRSLERRRPHRRRPCRPLGGPQRKCLCEMRGGDVHRMWRAGTVRIGGRGPAERLKIGDRIVRAMRRDQ